MSSSTVRVAPLHVGKYIPPPYAGIEAHVDTLLRSLGGSVDATLVASESNDRVASERQPLPYRVLAIRARGSIASVPISPGMLPAIRGEFAAGRANLLHLHAPNPWGDFAALSADKAIPVVLTWHSDIVRQRLLMKFYSHVQRRALERADRIIVFTPKHFESSTQLRGAGIEGKVVHVSLGIDFAGLDETPEDPVTLARVNEFAAARPVVLTIGRHVYYKGYEYLLDAMASLRSDAVLVMVGTGILSEALKLRARELGIVDRVLFMGEVTTSALVTLQHRCDIFALPSIEPSEAFGIATAETMAFGKPTVVCELNNGVNYLTRDGETGLTTQPRNVSALSDAIDRLVRDDLMRASMGIAAMRWARTEFAMEKMRDQTLALYQSLL